MFGYKIARGGLSSASKQQMGEILVTGSISESSCGSYWVLVNATVISESGSEVVVNL